MTWRKTVAPVISLLSAYYFFTWLHNVHGNGLAAFGAAGIALVVYALVSLISLAGRD